MPVFKSLMIMTTFGKKLRECREAKELSQTELAQALETNQSLIGKYERDDVKPTIDVVKKLATALDTSVSYLLGETTHAQLFRDKAMVKRLQDIYNLPPKDREHILYALDNLLKAAKINSL